MLPTLIAYLSLHAAPPARADAPPCFGVDAARLSPPAGPPRVTLVGPGGSRDVSPKWAVERMGAGGRLPADAGLLRVTVIDRDGAARGRVLADLDGSPELSAWKGRLVVNAFAPGDWQLACGFRAGGSTTVYCQAPSGKVLHRQDDYDGPAPLAGALRKADPNYDPSKDPDLRKPPKTPDPKPGPPPETPWLPILGAGGAVAAAVYLTRKKEK